MSPLRIRHGGLEAKVAHLLQLLKTDGICGIACGVQTAENVKVPDVIWVSLERHRVTPHEFAYAVDPEICVEIMSPSNYLEEQMHKGQLYLQAGAGEFWLCDELGKMRFFDASGEIAQSLLCPQFPVRVEVPD